MIITCPNCATHYNLAPASIGGAGKNVRCANCGTRWHQTNTSPPQAAPQMAAPQAVAPAFDATAMMAEMKAQLLQEMQTKFDELAASAPPPAPDPVPVPEPEPEPEPEYEEHPIEEPEPEPEPEPEEEELLSQDELDNMFGEDTDPEPVDSLVDEDDAEGDFIDVDDIPDPEPIPGSLLSSDDYEDEDEDDEDEGGSMRLIIVIVVLLGLFGGLFGGLFFARDTVMEMLPASKGVYKMIGLAAPLGDGLDIRGVRSARGLEGDVDVLNINGVIANISEEPRAVPMIRVSLFNSEDEEVQFQMVNPEKQELPPGDTLRFKASIMDPAATARRLEVTFNEAEGDAAGDGETKQ